MVKEYVKKHFDYTLLLTTVLLVGLGLTMVYSATAILARERYHDSLFFLKKEFIALILGCGALFVGWKLPLERWRQLVYPVFAVSLLLLVLVLVPGLGVKALGAQRWLKLGPLTFQPTELGKFAVVLFLAHVLSKKQEKIKIFLVGFAPPMVISGLMILLILAGKDLGNAVVLGATVFMLMFVGGAKPSYLISEILLAMPAFYYLVAGVAYRRQRIMAFLDPWRYEKGAGFQIIQSFLAFHSGGLFGQGLGEGKQKLFYLPEAHTDFIFSVVGEELGLFGTMIVIVLFAVWVFRAFAIAWKAPDAFSQYLAIGIGFMFGLQAVFNISVVMGLLPTKGLALPFLSYGGTSLIIALLGVGLLLNVSSRTEL